MSFADLKKKKTAPKSQKVSIDDFIDGATTYSKGGHQRELKPYQLTKKNKYKRAKHATFSLTDKCIEQLNNLAKETGINKSRLIRMLVNKTNKCEIKGLDKTFKEK